jgi:hypothetical protein
MPMLLLKKIKIKKEETHQRARGKHQNAHY